MRTERARNIIERVEAVMACCRIPGPLPVALKALQAARRVYWSLNRKLIEQAGEERGLVTYLR